MCKTKASVFENILTKLSDKVVLQIPQKWWEVVKVYRFANEMMNLVLNIGEFVGDD